MNERRIWIAWETQRRSISLAKRVGAELFILDLEHLGRWRYPVSIIRTLRLLIGNRGGVVFVQNPSLILAFIAALTKKLLGFHLIVDRHTNFVQIENTGSPVVRGLLRWMSTYSIRHADLTIVTNSLIDHQFIRGVGEGFVLPDPYPDVPRRDHGEAPRDELRVFFVSSWESDEPIREVMEVCRIMGGRVRVFISGRVKPSYAAAVAAKPDNFVVTGFLSDADYFELMASADCVLAVSSWPGTLCCGAYEGVAMGKPVIVSDDQVTRSYFSAGASYTTATVGDLEAQFRFVHGHLPQLRGEVGALYRSSAEAWEKQLEALIARITQQVTRGTT